MNHHVLRVSCKACTLGYKVVGSSKECARFKLLDALYCNEMCAAADYERHKEECNQQHLKDAYYEGY